MSAVNESGGAGAYVGMTATTNRLYLAVLTVVALAVGGILVLGLTGAGVVNAGPAAVPAGAPVQEATAQERFDRDLENVGRLMVAERDANYLAELRPAAPGLWSDATDAQVVQMGRLGCTLADQNGGDWTEGVTIMNASGFDPSDTGVLVAYAVRNFCPDTTF